MSSKAQRKQAAVILGSAKTAKKAKAARENGFKPKRKRKKTTAITIRTPTGAQQEELNRIYKVLVSEWQKGFKPKRKKKEKLGRIISNPIYTTDSVRLKDIHLPPTKAEIKWMDGQKKKGEMIITCSDA